MVIGGIVFSSIATLFWKPSNGFEYVADVLLRAYLMFLGTVMAHEGVHGHLGQTRAANFWLGRLALLPCMVPFTNFHKTHRLHHAHANDPEKDPDYFLRSRNALEIPCRALAMPHHWFFWLRKRGLIRKPDLVDLFLNYMGILVVYGIVLAFAGASRLFWGMVPPLVLVSMLLWYPFAIKTHEGYSVGTAESRSHNYYGRLMYWFSLGLSLHRIHHMRLELSWLELKDYVEEAPGSLWRRLLPLRDIRLDSPPS